MPVQSRASDAAHASGSTTQALGHFANGVFSMQGHHSFPRCRAAFDASLLRNAQPRHRIAGGEKAEQLRSPHAVRKMHLLCNTLPVEFHDW